MSLRLRLLLSTLLVGGVGLLVMNVAVHGLVRKSLFDRLDADLLELGSRRGGRGLDVGDRRGGQGPGRPTDRPLPSQLRPRDRISRLGFGQVYVEWRDATGKRIGSPTLIGVDETSSDVELDLPEVLTAPSRRPVFFNTTARSSSGKERFRVLTRMTPNAVDRATTATGLEAAARPTFVVTAISAREQDRTLRQLLTIQLLATAGVLAGLAAVAWASTRWLLKPLRRIEESAAAIAGGDLDHPIHGADSRTEVGRLGSALNTMMGRIRSSFAEEQAAQAKLRRFLADASHELRTPLTTVQGYAQLHQRTRAGADPETDKMMDRIGGAGARMGSLVEELLMLSRGENVDVPLLPVEIAPVLEAVVEDFLVAGSSERLHDSSVKPTELKLASPQRSINLSIDTDAAVLGDSGRLHRVVANLVENAVRHTPEAATVSVRAHMETDTGAHWVLIAVADTGPGIDPEHLDHLFDPFYRVDPSRSRGTGGAGLGLAIVSATVQSFGGSVTVHSEVGVGTTFTVKLPAATQ
jgi:two-component system, OmpR family, sensor kinase